MSGPSRREASGRGHAVVIGGCVAGLTAAGALARHFDQVTLVERDRFPDGPAYRKGIPQSRHLHVFLTGGLAALERLFPGVEDDLVAAGAVRVRSFEEIRWLNAQGWSERFPTGEHFLSCSRELFDWRLRERLHSLRNLEVKQASEVVELWAGEAGVSGVRLRERDAALAADLVVDASGRSTRAHQWLDALGYGRPAQTRIDASLAYASRVYAPPPGFSADWLALYLQPQPPATCRAGVLAPLEGGRWIATGSGVGQDHSPPTDEPGFLGFARSLRSPLLYEAIQDAEPRSPIWGYRRTENQRWHYERMRRWPERFVVIGDAACAFNPVYGHGMAVAAMTAVALDRRLAGAPADLSGFARRFQSQVAKCNAAAWLIATGEDLRYPTTTGARASRLTRCTHRYMDRVMRAANRDARANLAFAKVLGLVASPQSLFRPSVMALALARGGRPQRKEDPDE